MAKFDQKNKMQQLYKLKKNIKDTIITFVRHQNGHTKNKLMEIIRVISALTSKISNFLNVSVAY